MEFNWLAIGAAALSAFLLGAVWYGPLFGKKWQALVGLDDEQVKAAPMARILGGSFVLSLIAAAVFALFLGPDPEIGFALGAGASAGLCWVAASFGINYLFAQRPIGLFLIDGGYHTLQFTLYGLVLGLF
ncbi:MAG: DUF1761 domain-containing protein [Blastomonas sp.]